MTPTFEALLIILPVLLLLCVLISKISDRLGIPVLLLFLAIGMLAGSEGIGGIYFDDPHLTENIANLCLVFILFASGLDTSWKSVRAVFKEGVALATLGVILTAAVFGAIAYFILKLSWVESLLIGAIISSTDAAAVFSILRSRGLALKPRLAPVLELESGSNDPVAVILTISLLALYANPNESIPLLIGKFFLQIVVGGLLGWAFSKLALFLINRLKLGYEGLYPVLTTSLVILCFGLTTLLQGSGFLAVYLFGLLLGRTDFLHHHSTSRFFDSAAWISQITLFLTLGLLVFPTHLIKVALPALALALVLVLIARPIAVFITLMPFHYYWREKTFLAWVGLRGAVPIVLATYPLVAGIQNASLIFNIVFFVVITSVLLQGTLLPKMARWLQLESTETAALPIPLELTPQPSLTSQLSQTVIPPNAACIGKAIYELGLPSGYLVILITRGQEYLQPNGGTILQSEDTLLALTEKSALTTAVELLTRPKEAPVDELNQS